MRGRSIWVPCELIHEDLFEGFDCFVGGRGQLDNLPASAVLLHNPIPLHDVEVAGDEGECVVFGQVVVVVGVEEVGVFLARISR